MGQMEMKCILYSTRTKVTQVSDVAHGPLVIHSPCIIPDKFKQTKKRKACNEQSLIS
jgi:hypothetical protein